MNKSAVFWFEFFSKRFGPGARFSKDPETFRGPKANFKIKTCWIEVQFLAHKAVSFASLTDSFIVSLSKLLKLWSWMKTQQHKIAFPAWKVTRSGACFSNVPITFRPESCFMFAVFALKIKVSISLKMLTKQNWPVCELGGCDTIQQVLISKFALAPEKLPYLSRNEPLGPVSRKSRNRFGSGKLFCVCRVCIYEQSFSNYENDTLNCQ